MSASSFPSLKTWWYAARPHTLAASITPMLVLTGTLANNKLISPLPLMLCWIVAITAQIASNMANDYYDFQKGIDSNRKSGFDRLLTKGGMTPRQMFIGLMIVVLVCMLSGLALCLMQDMRLLLVGIAVLLGVFAYSAGPFPLSQHGLGDVAVVLFFGLVPILAGFYAVSLVKPPYYVTCLALAVGFWEANILVVNNYRDHDDDKAANKRTLIVRMGKKSGPILYSANALLSLICTAVGLWMAARHTAAWIVPLILCLPYIIGIFGISKFSGKRLNGVLVYTGRASLLLGLTLLITLLF